MSLRSRFPAPRQSKSHYFISISRGDRFRQVAVRPWALGAFGLLAPLAVVGFIGAGAYLAFRDDMLASILTRQLEMQYAYEDRLAAQRAQLDRVTSRQLLDQDTLEGRVHELLSRQAQIENRAAVIASLAEHIGAAVVGKPDSRIAAPARPPGTRNPLLAQPGSVALPAGASAFAPLPQGAAFSGARPEPSDKPRPDVLEQRSGVSPAGLSPVAAYADMPVDSRLRGITASLDKLDLTHVRIVGAMGAASRQTATRLRAAISETGLSPDRLAASASNPAAATGGPFVPIKADPRGSLFEREVYRLQNDFQMTWRLRRVAQALPVRKPLPGDLDVTSGFGGRADPFFGRLATHTGIDLRDPHGTPVRSTGAGKIVSAGWNGGYGNMVEIDHGNGLTTRYAHLSAILVSEDQSVEAGWIVGKLGSTGRSTGPHLHYEVRLNGDPVDPQRFLRAGMKLVAGG